MKMHVVDKRLLVDISVVLNDVRTTADLGNLYRSHWAGKGRDGGCGGRIGQGVYVQIENLPHLGPFPSCRVSDISGRYNPFRSLR
jgi:hypothetical protein